MTGRINAACEAVLSLTVRGASGDAAEAEVILDTGFTDYLTLPPDVVQTLNLELRETARFTLADGSQATLDVFRAEILWHGRWHPILVTSTYGDPLAGMALLHGLDVRLRVVEGGEVEIRPIPLEQA